MSEETELQDSLTPAEGDETPTVEEQASDSQPDQPQHTEAEKKLYARVKKAEEESKKLRDELAKRTPEPSAPQAPDDIETVLRLRSEGYSDKEVLDIRSKAKKYNIPIASLLEDDLLKAGIEANRQKAKVEQATPAPSARSGFLGKSGKSFAETPKEKRAEEFGFQTWKTKKGSGTV